MTDATASDQTLLTIAELARNLDLPESTTRYYCNRFAEHLASVGEGRRRRYMPEALDTLRTIVETMRRNKNAFAVDLMLRDRQEAAPAASTLPAIASGAVAAQMVTLMENQTQALQDIAKAITVFAERLPAPQASAGAASPADAAPEADAASPATAPSDDSQAPSETGAETEAALREEVASLREQMRTAESVHQNDLEQLRKWLARLGEALSAKQ